MREPFEFRLELLTVLYQVSCLVTGKKSLICFWFAKVRKTTNDLESMKLCFVIGMVVFLGAVNAISQQRFHN